MAEEFCCEKYKAQRLIEQYGLTESVLGDPMGAKRQFRDGKSALKCGFGALLATQVIWQLCANE